MRLPPPITRNLVLVGGGHAHALALRMWAMRPIEGVGVTLVSPAPVAAYSGMLPGFVAGHYRPEALQIDLVRLAGRAGARLILGQALGIDRAGRQVMIEGRAPVDWDILSLNTGITSVMPDLPGFAAHAVPAKPLDRFAARWQAFVGAVAEGTARPVVAVIGAGLAGAELALAMAYRLRQTAPPGQTVKVSLIEAARALSAVGPGARRALLAHLSSAGVELHEGQPATAIEPDAVRLADGRRIPSVLTVGTAGARAPDWPARAGLATEGGFVRVGPTLQTETDPDIFAAGDLAWMVHAPRPRAGVFAVRQAPVLFENLRRRLLDDGQPLRSYRPQKDYLKLVSTGGRNAVADKWGLPLDGAALWRWKDRIDRTFMAKFTDLPAMPAEGARRPDRLPATETDPFGGRPLCGGCGAKVGRPALLRALGGLPAPARPDVVKGAGDDAAILRPPPGGHQLLTTDHLRAFWPDPWLMARIAAIHAMGDIWSMGATLQAAMAQVILPPMGEDQQAGALREIMDAAWSVIGPEGGDIVGGHTSMGSELTIGFALTGLTPGRVVTHGGARAGDCLILTKPVGSGTVMAAAMAGTAPGPAVAAALASMARPQGAAARLLAPAASAMTDVTGFGLAGHLLTILESSGLAADIRLAAIPFLPGAVDLARAGEGSSLFAANQGARAKMFAPEAPQTDLLFDPQTAGGLLAAVAPDEAPALIDALAAAGEMAAAIGTLREGAPFIDVTGDWPPPAARP